MRDPYREITDMFDALLSEPWAHERKTTMLDRTLANLDHLSKDPAHRGQVSTIAACAAHNVRQHMATAADERATLMGFVLVARGADNAKLGAYVRGRLIALGLL